MASVSVPPRVLGTRVEPPPIPRGSDVAAEREVIEVLNDESRWPLNNDPAPDSISANNRAQEAWLGACEWPRASNNWLSRRGHPLTPAPGEYKHHSWIHVCSLEQLSGPAPGRAVPQGSCGATNPDMPPHGSAVDFTWHGRVAPRKHAPTWRLTPHVIQGGASEALDIEYARAATLVWEAAPRVEAAKPAKAIIQAAVAAARVRGDQLDVARHAMAASFPQARAPTSGKGFRPGSAAHRRAIGGRPLPWPGSGSGGAAVSGLGWAPR